MGVADDILKPGQIFEKYHVQKLLGKGGMGAVYLVRHTVLDSLFALKVLFPEAAAKNRQFVERFIREAKLACKIKHPNLIAVHDAGECDGIYYLVMDYVPGSDLRGLIALHGQIPAPRAIQIVRELTLALETARAFNMVHRDIKPENIMFDANGAVKLADLGIAKSIDEEGPLLTQEASVFGTPAYMSPEQARDPRKVDCRADLYSVGIVLYEMLCGERPFPGKTAMEILAKVIGKEKIPDVRTRNPGVAADLAEIVNDLCEKNVNKRIQTPQELLRRLEAIKEPDVGTTVASFVNKVLNETGRDASRIETPQMTLPTMPGVAGAAQAESRRPSVEVTMPTVPESNCAHPPSAISPVETTNPKSHRLLFVAVSFSVIALLGAGVKLLLSGSSSGASDDSSEEAHPAVQIVAEPMPPPSAVKIEEERPAVETEPVQSNKVESAVTVIPPVVARVMTQDSVVVIGDASLGGDVYVPASRQDWQRLIGEARAANVRQIVLAPAVWYEVRRLPRGNFDHFVAGLATMVRGSNIPFAFLLDTSVLSARVKVICDSKSYQTYDSGRSDF